MLGMRLALLAPALWSIVAATLPADAQIPQPEGGEFRVESHTSVYGHDYPSVATEPDGDFVVVWQSYASSPGNDNSGTSIQGRRFASDGTALAAQFQVNTYTTGFQRIPSVSIADDGAFVVVWWGNGSFGTDASFSSVQGQRYASNGSPQGGQFQINTYTTLDQNSATVASAAGGDFVVVWTSMGSSGTDTSGYSVQGQRFASNGTPQGGQFQVNTFTTSVQENFRTHSVAADDDGDFVVVWDSYGSLGTDTTGFSIQSQRYASNGTPLGAQFQVNSYATGGQFRPSVAADQDGDFVVVWDSNGSPGTDHSSYSVQGQRFASNGMPEGGQFQVNAYTTGYQEVTSVAADADRDFVVVWDGVGSFGGDTSGESVQGRRYGSNGSSPGGQFQINTFTTGFQRAPAVGAAADGDFVVAWASESFTGPGLLPAIVGQRFGLAPAPPVPAMSTATRFALGVALLLLGASCVLRGRSSDRRS
jgi:hypothetical protein